MEHTKRNVTATEVAVNLGRRTLMGLDSMSMCKALGTGNLGGKERPGHKYIKREWKDGKWLYWYRTASGKMVTGEKPADHQITTMNLQKHPDDGSKAKPETKVEGKEEKKEGIKLSEDTYQVDSRSVAVARAKKYNQRVFVGDSGKYWVVDDKDIKHFENKDFTEIKEEKLAETKVPSQKDKMSAIKQELGVEKKESDRPAEKKDMSPEQQESLIVAIENDSGIKDHMWYRKPQTFKDVTTSYTPTTDSIKKQIDSLETFTEDKVPNRETTKSRIYKIKDKTTGKTYLVDTEGASYPRHMTELKESSNSNIHAETKVLVDKYGKEKLLRMIQEMEGGKKEEKLKNISVPVPTEDQFGFYGTIQSNSNDNFSRTELKDIWDGAVNTIAEVLNTDATKDIENFLRSRAGRHFADELSFESKVDDKEGLIKAVKTVLTGAHAKSWKREFESVKNYVKQGKRGSSIYFAGWRR